MSACVAKVAISGISYTIDHTYSYLVPSALADGLREGTRVLVPFGVRNRRSEAMILELSHTDEPPENLKTVIRALESKPVFSAELIKLALWMRNRCFCTYYEAARAMLPTGIWYSLEDELRLSDGMDVAAALALCASDDEKRLVESLGRKLIAADAEASFGRAAVTALTSRGVLTRETAAIRGIADKTIRIYTLAEPDSVDAYIEKQSKKSPRRCDIARFVRDAGADGAAAGEIIYFTGHSQSAITGMVRSGVLIEEHRTTYRRPYYGAAIPKPDVELSPEQRSAADRLRDLLEQPSPAPALLYGVTGSGKTEVYINVIERALELDRGALILAPEIALTPQLMRVFRSRFGERVAILHSALTTGERADEWRRIKAGEADIVLGTRSAVFAPVKNLGIIVMDEEQERSYKSESLPRYHARDVVLRRAAALGALAVLGSATPSLESYHAAVSGRFELLTLTARFSDRPMPRVELADMRAELRAGNSGAISAVLRARITETLERGKQVILFLNRRGNSRRVICPDCGWLPECDNCSVALTYHSANNRLMCHYCGASHALPAACPGCGGELKFVGVGTQRCEQELSELFPSARILRMDSDTTAPRGSHEDILSRFRDGGADILLGTQMIAKGLDFENVTLVGVISADMSLYADDFRANERTFSILTQVVGRAGRGADEGCAVVQTFTPANPVIEAAARQDYESFFASEIALRAKLHYPPFSDFIVVEVSGATADGVLKAAFETREQLRDITRRHSLEASVMGPVQAAIFRVNNRYRYRILLNGTLTRELTLAVSAVIKAFKSNRLYKPYSIYADINPNET